MTNDRKPSSANQLFFFDCTYFADLSCQPVVHAALTKVAKHFHYQLEKCPNSGNLHYQIYVNLKVKKRDRELGKLLSGLGMPGVSCRPASDEGKTILKEYCLKPDTRVAGPWADKPLYLGADLITTLRPWQVHIRDLIYKEPDSRQIVWYYDSIGKHGKTSISKYMYFHHKILTLTIGRASDVLNLVYKLQGHKMYIFDIARTVNESQMNDIYYALESVKNGYFINTKYDTGVACMNIPHVIVFSNHLPKMSALSADRWKIINMQEDFGPLHFSKLNI